MVLYTVKKALNNNVLIASDDEGQEVVLIGKGIGFNRKKNDTITEDAIEKLFVLRNEREQANYIKLLPQVDEAVLKTIIESINIIQARSNTPLHEKVHVALTDHTAFAITRLLKGMAIKNPFLKETKALYPAEYEIAADVVDYINQSLQVELPEGEIGFIALHIHSAITDKAIADLNKYSQLVTKLINVIEDQLEIQIDRESIHYLRLVRHLRYTIERITNNEFIEEPEKIANLLKTEYPVCYNLAWKLIKIMQQTLNTSVYDGEVVYLTMHLQRLNNKID
ncbi:PRD domain-containing protein [Oceanobacillus profundus]|uniref:PRD domain-containing protein n=1 Tax=Oceanobacillus profundus TaxID=372463 RepID=A0A417YAT4_9BACI|nr:PRD domain-containing protein [Oceanobacillus profundus]MBR3120050.1 PRD domain-containing protein [Oceanobacillus sp.]MDO6451823.1 PRD domain-containing protein [Oceanobacillus profundus]RHW29626.1 PRD domain-containing protein [Oceanobacillus profundus]